MSDVVEEFLAHHGIKGMKWGVRRDSTSSSSGGSAGRTIVKAPAGVKLSDPAHPLHGSGLTVVSGKGTKRDPFVAEKLSGHGASATHPSVDAERFVKTNKKAGVEMSDREIKEAVARANLVESYNKIFSPDPNQQLKSQVESLRLTKEYSTLHQQLHPSLSTRVARFVSTAGTTGFKTYSLLNKATDGELNRQLVKALGLEKKFPGMAKVAKTATPGKPATPTIS